MTKEEYYWFDNEDEDKTIKVFSDRLEVVATEIKKCIGGYKVMYNNTVMLRFVKKPLNDIGQVKYNAIKESLNKLRDNRHAKLLDG